MSEADEVIKNAVNVDIKEQHGDSAFVHHTIVVTLIELPKTPGANPGEPRAFCQVKSLGQPVAMQTAIRMLSDAAAKVRLQSEGEATT